MTTRPKKLSFLSAIAAFAGLDDVAMRAAKEMRSRSGTIYDQKRNNPLGRYHVIGSYAQRTKSGRVRTIKRMQLIDRGKYNRVQRKPEAA